MTIIKQFLHIGPSPFSLCLYFSFINSAVGLCKSQRVLNAGLKEIKKEGEKIGRKKLISKFLL
jgi:hypothetical protein